MSDLSEAKQWSREVMKGLWTSPMIPMTASGEVDHDGIRHNVEYLIDCKLDGVGFGFSEPWYLTIRERVEAFETFISAVNRRIPAYLHAMDYAVPEAINLVNHAKEIGADAVMLWTPMEFAKTQDAIVDWYTHISSNVDFRIIAYNTYHAGRSFTIDTIRRLAELPNICALKDAINDFGHTVAAIDAAGDQIVISNPLEKHLPAMKMFGGQQILLGTTSMFLMQSPRWQPVRDYVRAIDNGDHASAWQQFYALEPLRDIWNAIYEPLWNKGGATHPISLIKHWMDIIGMRGGAVRAPMRSATGAERDALRARLQATGLLERLVVS